MDRIKKIFRLIHVSLWALFTLLVVLQLRGETNPHWLTLTVGVVASATGVFYSHFYLLTHYTGTRKGYWLRLAAIWLIGPLPFLLFHYKDFSLSNPFIGYYCMTLVTLVPIFIFLGWLARVTETLVINTIKKEQLEKQAVEAELYYLKSQINPHFLFNTLNNIHTLVYKQAPAAPEAVMHLASLMRYMIYESNAATVPLARELDYLRDYVSLQQLRYKNSPIVDLQISGNATACRIAPLLFIHLLENAYKHSPARLEPGDLKVCVAVQEDTLTFSVQNPIGQQATSPLEGPGGIGLPNVRKRLALLYPEQHSLTIQNTGHTFTVNLTIHGLHAPAHERKAQLLHH
ncbi:sensor histidine kinase [Hymenobacter properus]|uniref:Sensor histidine kinase n=1 Tax=Hymenobacter properus TaxID=2791026 RepID=A0A931BC30_9BACT|nr:sensor histidine kinase [Hymenobacter properus]MBF9141024.1 sensor histidine kinase [Hymenobacter properus]MBR7719833.1 sensor histidine kinase [Microvirga sp. SRT04]